MLVRLGSAGSEVVEPDQVKAELSRVLGCQECYRKICIYLKNKWISALFFLNANIFLALLFRITYLSGCPELHFRTQLKTVDSWKEADTLEIRDVWYAFLTSLKKWICLFSSHVPAHPRIAASRTLEKHVFLGIMLGRRGLRFFDSSGKLWISSSKFVISVEKPRNQQGIPPLSNSGLHLKKCLSMYGLIGSLSCFFSVNKLAAIIYWWVTQ